MGRLRIFQTVSLALIAIWAGWLAASPVSAQIATATPTSLPTSATPESDSTADDSTPAATRGSTAQADSPLLPTPTPNVPPSAGEIAPQATPVAISAPLEGTIIANRSNQDVRYFVEGVTYVLAAGRSQGLTLPRPTTVLNLFNCEATAPDSQDGCFWDPYVLRQDGFYEVYASPEANAGAAGATLLLREAGAPPANQVWVQNRTVELETVVFRGETFEIEPTAIREFPVETGVPAILYVRHCLTLDEQSVCEWSPKTLTAGIYYALEEVDTPGAEPGSFITAIDVHPVVGEIGAAATATPTATIAPNTTAVAPAGATTTPAVNESAPIATATVAAIPATTGASTPGAIICTLEVPALNIRSGPGLQYEIIGKVRTTGTEAATVGVIARSSDDQWLVVDPSIMSDGWITSSSSFITCGGDLNTLPLGEAPPPPVPAIVQEPPVAESTPATPTESQPVTTPDSGIVTTEPITDSVAGETPAAETPTASSGVEAAIPPGQAMLVVNNGFQHEMRFTIDQRYRPTEGPSEYDLQPGGSIAIIVNPGEVAFTASSPWSNLSGNSTLTIDADTALSLWLRFELDGDAWALRWN